MTSFLYAVFSQPHDFYDEVFFADNCVLWAKLLTVITGNEMAIKQEK